MKKTEIDRASEPCIEYHQQHLFLGSCFSENLSLKMADNGFSVVANPFGVVYNPISLSDVILANEGDIKASVFQREDVWLSWLSNSTCFAYQKEDLIEDLINKQYHFLDLLKKNAIQYITFGTAWIYTQVKNNRIVGNCHKNPKNTFEKSLLSIQEIVERWSKVIVFLKQLNPEIQLIFTVSPVRHIKDGIIENSRSKAILLESVHRIVSTHSQSSYFPSYEIMVDELRDYAYYTTDGIHPNEIAIDIIWEAFVTTYFKEETKKIANDFQQVKQLFKHRLLHPKSKSSLRFEENRLKIWEEFMVKYPFFESYKMQE